MTAANAAILMYHLWAMSKIAPLPAHLEALKQPIVTGR
jgi:hypothetical protein